MGRAALLPLLWLGLLAGCASAPAEEDRAPAAAEPVATTRAFALHSHPWVNLHHLLYQWARAEAERDPSERSRPVAVAERSATFDERERGRWDAALAAYAGLAGRDLLFDPEMRAIGNAVAAAAAPDPSAGGAPAGALPAEVDAPLRAAWPVYRARFWEEHDRANRAWIDAVLPLLERHEERLVADLARALGGAPPAEPIRVDVSAYANWAGAYTSNDPEHVVIASRDPRQLGVQGLETLLHEASHTTSLGGRVQDDLAAAFAAEGAEPPRDLWHVLFFFTAGELAARTLATEGVEGYVPYAERHGLYARAPGWAEQRAALERCWRPFLAGEIERDEALRRLAAELAAPAGG